MTGKNEERNSDENFTDCQRCGFGICHAVDCHFVCAARGSTASARARTRTRDGTGHGPRHTDDPHHGTGNDSGARCRACARTRARTCPSGSR